MAAADPALIGKRLRRWRDAKNWSGAEAAAPAGLTWAELGPIERGEVSAPTDQLDRLAAGFGRPLNELIGPPTVEDEPPPPPPPPPDTRPDRLRQRSPLRPGTAGTVNDSWDLHPGDQIRRVELHKRYGGNGQSGIAPSAKSSNVFVFSDPSGEEHGYYDRWDHEAGVFLYCGEGQTGDQQLDKGNAAILNHRRDGRSLRVFEGSGGVVTYAGEFEVAHTRPYQTEQSHESGNQRIRRVFVFRLTPVTS